jgi:tetratricopeptide (TPR) repeat protein
VSRATAIGIVVGVALAALTWVPGSPLRGAAWPVATNVVALLLCVLLLTMVHELGHAVAGLALGLRVSAVVLGAGPPLAEGRLGGVRVTLARLPLGGVTLLGVRPKTSRPALRLGLTFLAGPLVNGLLLLGMGLAHGLGRMFSLAWLAGVSPVEAFGWANLLFVVISLIPYRTATPFGLVPSDGGRLLEALREPREIAAKGYQAYYAVDGHEALRVGDFQGAARRYRDGIAEHPHSFMLRHGLALALINLERFAEARQELVPLFQAREAERPEIRLALKNSIAYCDVMLATQGQAELLEEADRYTEQTMREGRGIWSYAGTRGAVLLQQGRIEEALRLLGNAYSGGRDAVARATNAGWIAVAEARRGAPDRARRWLEKGRALGVPVHTLKLAEEALAGET